MASSSLTSLPKSTSNVASIRLLRRQVAQQLMANDALTAHARDELGISEITTARPVQAALTSAATFSVGAAMPLLMVVVSPADVLVPIVSGASLGFLALLGAIGARAGRRQCSARHSPNDILGRVCDGSNRRYRESFRRGCLRSRPRKGSSKRQARIEAGLPLLPWFAQAA